MSIANTGKNSIEIHGMSIHLLGIIRTERQGIEKVGVEGLLSGVPGMGIRGGRAGNLEKGCRNKMEEKSKAAHAKPASGGKNAKNRRNEGGREYNGAQPEGRNGNPGVGIHPYDKEQRQRPSSTAAA
jgi:hypothetical protein